MIRILKLMSSLKIVAMLVAVLALASCGRAGPPIKPSEAAIKKAKADGTPAPEKPVPNAQNPDKRFVLDGLLE
jgi:predicted small lipoprotein YifL